jgi:hypothetical protein
MPALSEIIASRQAEVDQYDQNIALYEAILTDLPDKWPTRLEEFKGRKDHQQAVTECDPSDVELLAQLLYREQCENTIRAERLERTKAAAILKALKA